MSAVTTSSIRRDWLYCENQLATLGYISTSTPMRSTNDISALNHGIRQRRGRGVGALAGLGCEATSSILVPLLTPFSGRRGDSPPTEWLLITAVH